MYCRQAVTLLNEETVSSRFVDWRRLYFFTRHRVQLWRIQSLKWKNTMWEKKQTSPLWSSTLLFFSVHIINQSSDFSNSPSKPSHTCMLMYIHSSFIHTLTHSTVLCFLSSCGSPTMNKVWKTFPLFVVGFFCSCDFLHYSIYSPADTDAVRKDKTILWRLGEMRWWSIGCTGSVVFTLGWWGHCMLKRKQHEKSGSFLDWWKPKTGPAQEGFFIPWNET